MNRDTLSLALLVSTLVSNADLSFNMTSIHHEHAFYKQAPYVIIITIINIISICYWSFWPNLTPINVELLLFHKTLILALFTVLNGCMDYS